LPVLAPSPGKDRILISSTGADQPARFISNGDISFSKFFWAHVLNGANVEQSFLDTKVAIEFVGNSQTPHRDDDGNGVGNEVSDGQLARAYTIGLGVMLAGDDPLIGSICPEQNLNDGGASTKLWVDNVTTTGSIDKVWAVITPPDFDPGDDACASVLPMMELSYVGAGRYEATYRGFFALGTYQVAAYAMDSSGNVSLPRETMVHQSVESIPEPGDTNADGFVDAVDIQMVINEVLGLSTGYDCDLNEDNDINAVDVQLVINAALGFDISGLL
jgi:hypothetical protein